jgi:hypothetical protein
MTRPQLSQADRRRLTTLTIGGGAAFWLVNLAISLTPIAVDYRAALSIAYVPMLLEALLGGMVIATGVAFAVVRWCDVIPARRPLVTSLTLSAVALALATLLIEVPAKLGSATGDALHYLLIATVFNVLRILALGLAVGWLYARPRPA